MSWSGGVTTTPSLSSCAAPELLLLPDLGALGAGVGALPPFAFQRAVALDVHDHDDRAPLVESGDGNLVADHLTDAEIFAAIPVQVEGTGLVHGDGERASPVIGTAVGFGAGDDIIAD